MPDIKLVPHGAISGSTWRNGCYLDLWFEQTQFFKSAKNGDFDAKFFAENGLTLYP